MMRRLALWLLVLASGFGLMQLVPPYRSPDEAVHLGRAYLLSQGQWRLDDPRLLGPGPYVSARGDFVATGREGASSGGFVDLNALRHALHFFTLPSLQNPDVRARGEALASRPWDASQKVYAELSGSGYYFPAVYLPHAAAMRTGQLLGLSVGATYRLTRGVVFVTAVALLAAACHVLLPGAGTAALLLLPMTMFQFASPTIDGLTIALFMLALALFTHLWQAGGAASWSGWALLLGAIGLVVTSRTQMLPLLFLPFALAWRARSPARALASAAVAAASLAWIAAAIGSTVDKRVVRHASTFEIVRHQLTHPGDFFALLASTLADPQTLAFYAASFVGILGSLSLRLSVAAYVVLALLLAVALTASATRARDLGDAAWRALLLATSALSALLVFFAMLVGWTPDPATRIEGVQGRYFLMPALLAAMALGGLPRPAATLPLAARVGVAACGAIAVTGFAASALALAAAR